MIVFPENYLFFFSLFSSRNRFNEARETFYVNSSDFYDSFGLCIFFLVGYSFILRNFITQREVNWTIGSFLCVSIDSFDDTKTVRKFLTVIMLCYKQDTMLLHITEDITEVSHGPVYVMPRTKYFASIPPESCTFKYIQPLCTKSNSSNFYDSVSLESSSRNIPPFHFIHRYNKSRYIYFLQNRDKSQCDAFSCMHNYEMKWISL